MCVRKQCGADSPSAAAGAHGVDDAVEIGVGHGRAGGEAEAVVEEAFGACPLRAHAIGSLG